VHAIEHGLPLMEPLRAQFALVTEQSVAKGDPE